MKKNSLFTFMAIVFLMAHLPSFAQTHCDCYERLKRLSGYKYSQNDFKGGYDALQKALKYRDDSLRTADDYWYLADFQSALGKYGDAKQNVIKCIAHGGTVKMLQTDTAFKRLFTPQFIDKLHEQEDKNKLKVDLDYFAALSQIGGSDQAIREDYFPKDSSALKAFQAIDSADFYRLKSLVAQHGYPDFYRSGFDCDRDIMLFCMHASVTSPTLYKKVLAFVEQQQKLGYMTKSQEATIIDRHREWRENKKQLFGNWQASRLPVVADPATIDKERYKYNLLSFGDQCKEMGYAPPKDYKPQPYPKGYFCK